MKKLKVALIALFVVPIGVFCGALEGALDTWDEMKQALRDRWDGGRSKALSRARSNVKSVQQVLDEYGSSQVSTSVPILIEVMRHQAERLASVLDDLNGIEQ